jgi:hypothetical protein
VTKTKKSTPDSAALLAAGRAAGYCWEQKPGGRGRCTRSPKHNGPHKDYYNGRKDVTDTVGYVWPQQ